MEMERIRETRTRDEDERRETRGEAAYVKASPGDVEGVQTYTRTHTRLPIQTAPQIHTHAHIQTAPWEAAPALTCAAHTDVSEYGS
jgi:hypothetical protein